ncbi:MAG: hypothetical protein JW789_00550 [Candidatus Aenigmarchaeota archaeon]|nr:hypothetical protein [Candidatus Aenigmarchaeota archaeon]
MNNEVTDAFGKSGKSLCNSLPVLAGAVLLVGLASSLVPHTFYSSIFSHNPLIDSLIGSTAGSFLAGNPLTSYVLGGEMLSQGVSLLAVTSFLVAWVTVGMVQLPAESILLGRRFAVLRNILSFVFSILVAFTTVYITGLL